MDNYYCICVDKNVVVKSKLGQHRQSTLSLKTFLIKNIFLIDIVIIKKSFFLKKKERIKFLKSEIRIL